MNTALEQAYERRTLSAHYAELDASLTEDEAIEAAAAEIWALLISQVDGYLQARCRAKAREQIERELVQAEAEAVADRMAA